MLKGLKKSFKKFKKKLSGKPKPKVVRQRRRSDEVGEDERAVVVRLPASMIEYVDKFANIHELTRTQEIQNLVRSGIRLAHTMQAQDEIISDAKSIIAENPDSAD